MINADIFTEFKNIFKFKEKYDSLEEYDKASENPSNFEDVRYFWNYKIHRGNSTKYNYANFQKEFIFHFLNAPSFGRDFEAEEKAHDFDPEVFQRISSIPDSTDGYQDFPDNGLTVNQSRHWAMLTFLVSNLLKRGVDLKNSNFFEIGGGFGNFVRIISKTYEFKNWIIFDIDFVNNLQQQFLRSNLVAQSLRNQIFDRKGKEVYLIDQNNRNTFVDSITDSDIDILIATHSLSEFSYDEFLWYFKNLVVRSKYFLYSYCHHFPSNELTEKKYKKILSFMKPIFSESTEGGGVHHVIFERLNNV